MSREFWAEAWESAEVVGEGRVFAVCVEFAEPDSGQLIGTIVSGVSHLPSDPERLYEGSVDRTRQWVERLAEKVLDAGSFIDAFPQKEVPICLTVWDGQWEHPLDVVDLRVTEKRR